ncbi:arsenite methyltransferase [Thermohalobacter berrensis]|uniref:Arsenite methyltransferase n=1 Tax=Thermohalobacter berrensis TaxID=99594 RepID=A0A419T0V9_9FIRM|nr:arsenite methyltransferase [Thermohalobacter berrensis]RKD31194.1 arsenite S-adenosylmethyltransferase [Thermohalobacter berrensis]
MNSDIKKNVKKYYGSIAKEVLNGSTNGCGCGPSCCSNPMDVTLFYEKETIKDLPKEAVNASLGCANPIIFADIKEGETVLDLGSGGGIDALQVSKQVGLNGKVYGLDMTDEMLQLANKNKEKSGVTNVEFMKGYIEDIPLEDNIIDVIISNCVINLSENKKKAISEAYRVLKNGGRLCIADIVTTKEVPKKLVESVGMWVGCIAGALSISEYKEILKEVGFKNVRIIKAQSYDKRFIKDMAEKFNENINEIFSEEEIELLDNAFASAIIKGVKDE